MGGVKEFINGPLIQHVLAQAAMTTALCLKE
jgi:hypothetical protein